MTVDHKKRKEKLLSYNKYAAYLHLLNFVSQVGLYYYSTKSFPDGPYNLRITETDFKLTEGWDRVLDLKGKNNVDIEINNDGVITDEEYRKIGRDIATSVQRNFRNLRDKEVTKYKIPLALIVASFSFMSFLSHVALITLDKRYYSWIKNYKVNFVRWIEYFISSPTMILAIAGLCNITNINDIQGIMISTAITNVFGLMAEIIKDDPNYGFMSKIFYIIGFLPFQSSWAPIFSRFRNLVAYVKGGRDSDLASDYINILGEDSYTTTFEEDYKIPDYIKYAVYVLYGFYYLFPLNFGLQNYILPKRDKFLGIKYNPKTDPYYFGEIGYITLSYVSKATLSWIIFSGTNKPNDDYLQKDDFSTSGGTIINNKYIYLGLAGLAGLSYYYSNKYKLSDPDPEIKPIKYLTVDDQIYEILNNKDVDTMSDKEVRNLWKRIKKLK